MTLPLKRNENLQFEDIRDFRDNLADMALKYNETPGTITQKPRVPWGKVVWN